jgi:ABC-type branched-subunit amino acid transport system substrate-binding protein
MRLQHCAHTRPTGQAIFLGLNLVLIAALLASCTRSSGRPIPGEPRAADAPPSQLGRDTGQSAYGRGVDTPATSAPDGSGTDISADTPGVPGDSIYLPTEPQTETRKSETRSGRTSAAGGDNTMQPQGSAAQRNRPVKIGLLVPLSGKGKDIGKAIMNAAQMAIFNMQANNFRLMPRDTRGTAKGARKAARDVLEDGAQLIIGPLFAESVRAAGNIASDHNVNVIGYSTDWRVAGGNILTMGFLPYNQVRRVMTYANAQGYRKFGVIAPDNMYGDAVMESYTHLTSRRDLKTVDVMRYNKSDSSISPRIREFTRYDKRLKQEPLASQIEDAKKTNKNGKDQKNKDKDKDKPQPGETIAKGPPPFEAVLMAVGGDQAQAMANLLSYYELPPDRVKRLGTGLWDDAGLAGESNLDGAWYAAPDPRLRSDFEKRYAQNYDTKPPRLATLGYDSAALAIVLGRRGLRQRGQPAYTWSDLTVANGFAGIDGIFRFRDGGLVDRGLAVLEIDEGEIKVISPAPKTFQRPQRSRKTNGQPRSGGQKVRTRGGFQKLRTSY